MKNFNSIFSTLLVVAILTGCGSWKQDPLADKDEAFKNAQQKPTLPEAPKPTDSNAVRLDTVDFYKFREGVAGEFTMTARVLEAGYTPVIYIDNMSDFPGASYNASNGKFTWTPPMGTVSGDNGLEESRALKVRVVGNKPNAKVLTSDFKVDLRVGKVLNVPEVFSVSKTSASMREGDMMNITVKVRDREAGTGMNSYPNLLILPIIGYGNISQYVTITQVLALGNNEFNINLQIDLSGAELTKSRDRYGFTLKAISRFQQASAPTDITVNVVTSLADLQSTWFAPLDVAMGVKKEFQFMIFDPKDELFVAPPTFSGVPNGATINCSGVNVTRQFCTFSWTPDFMVTPGSYSITAQVTGRNQDSQDTTGFKTYNFKLDLNVTSAPPVKPTALKGDH
jgi:hypothetical protein